MRLFFKSLFTIERLTPIDDTDQEDYQSYGSVYGMVVSIAPSDAFLSDGNLSQSSTLICDPSTTLSVSDRLTRNGRSYIVRGVKAPEGLFGVQFQRAVIELLNP